MNIPAIGSKWVKRWGMDAVLEVIGFSEEIGSEQTNRVTVVICKDAMDHFFSCRMNNWYKLQPAVDLYLIDSTEPQIKTTSNTCFHGKLHTGYCQPCGRINGGGQ